MSPEEERFNELLSRLKNSIPYPPQAVTETTADWLTLLDIEIWIMESEEIFYQGRLKGRRKATADRPEYNSHPINDLETFIEKAASELWWWLKAKESKYTDREGSTERITKLFDRLFLAYDEVARAIAYMNLFNGTTFKKNTIIHKTIIKQNTISDIKKVIEGWKVKILKNIKPMFTEDDIKEELAKLFIIHVPDARPLRIAKCVSVLLSPPPFNIVVNIGTFRKDVAKMKFYIDLEREV